jgi:hypothetical protein
VASARRNASTFLERSSLSSAPSLMMFMNAVANTYVDVCYFHFSALALYSFKHSPSIHRYV